MVGQTQAFTPANVAATAVVTWTSSDSTVVTIDSSGNASAIARGAATITAMSDDGQSATLAIQVVPNYQGNWTGRATVTACTDIGGFTANGYCSQRIRTSQPLTMNLTQTALGISGTISLAEAGGQVSGSVSGAIAAASGEITSLVGVLAGVVNGSNTALTLISWNSFATPTVMTGNLAGNVTSSQVVGIATVQWQFGGVTRSPSGLSPFFGSTRAAPFVR